MKICTMVDIVDKLLQVKRGLRRSMRRDMIGTPAATSTPSIKEDVRRLLGTSRSTSSNPKVPTCESANGKFYACE